MAAAADDVGIDNADAPPPAVGRRRPKHRRSRSIPLKLNTTFSFLNEGQEVDSPYGSELREEVQRPQVVQEIECVPGYPEVPAHWATPDGVWVTEPSLNVHVAAWFLCPKLPTDAPAMVVELHEASRRFALAIETKARMRREAEVTEAPGASVKPAVAQGLVSMLFGVRPPAPPPDNTDRSKATAQEPASLPTSPVSGPAGSTNRRLSMPERQWAIPLAPIRMKSFSSGCPLATNKKFGMLDALFYYTVRRRRIITTSEGVGGAAETVSPSDPQP